MKKIIKWPLISCGILFVLVIAALFIIPSFVDVQKFRPVIEKKVSDITGCPFKIGGRIRLSLFPWAGLAFSDLHLGNPPGFMEKDFISVRSFDVKVKLIPLLFRNIEIKRFIVEGAGIVLIRDKDGKTNWEMTGRKKQKVFPESREKRAKPKKSNAEKGLPFKTITMGEFSFKDSSILLIDHSKGKSIDISDICLLLKNVSLERPFHLALSAQIDGKPFSADGSIGPIGQKPGKDSIPFDISINLLKQIDIKLTGKVEDPAITPRYNITFMTSSFAPRKFLADLGRNLPYTTADPDALKLLTVKAVLKGDQNSISVSDGSLNIDESRLAFSIKAKNFSRPNLGFDLDLDKIDLDRYLPPPCKAKKAGPEKKESHPRIPQENKINYSPLKRLVLNGGIRIGRLKVHNTNIQDLYMKITGKNGLFNVDPLKLNLYRGNITARCSLDVREDIPKSRVDLQAKGIQAGPFLEDCIKLKLITGVIQSNIQVEISGIDAEEIKRTLNGKGGFLLKDGKIKGIDLSGMVRNKKSSFDLAKEREQLKETGFSEIKSYFTISNGIVNTPRTSFVSPLIHVLIHGNADIVREKLDIRVEPEYVYTRKKRDKKKLVKYVVPLIVTGDFSSPVFRPDIEKIMNRELKKKLNNSSKLKKYLKKKGISEEDSKLLKKNLEDILHNLLRKD
ncbi:MAG: hypothetical protein B1H11_00150 [Desulfobacteraceae bacterium 4484_190.1]|nr:MAG: hypothetical protein B1H11_00150 [Desulfobacteraceae bacterium 4484_190.1]